MNVTYNDDGTPERACVKSGYMKAKVEFDGTTARFAELETRDVVDAGRRVGRVDPDRITDIIAQVRALPFVEEFFAFGVEVDP